MRILLDDAFEEAMGVKAGQTIRLVVREACAGKVGGVTQGFFPEIVLTLK